MVDASNINVEAKAHSSPVPVNMGNLSAQKTCAVNVSAQPADLGPVVELGEQDGELVHARGLLRAGDHADNLHDVVVGHLRGEARAAGAEATRGPRKRRVAGIVPQTVGFEMFWKYQTTSFWLVSRL